LCLYHPTYILIIVVVVVVVVVVVGCTTGRHLG
jgi:hypothetical protein